MNPEQNGHVPQPAEMCPVERPIGVIGIPRQVPGLSKLMEIQPQTEIQLQAVNGRWPHQWQYVHQLQSAFCCWCGAMAPTQRQPIPLRQQQG